MYVCMCMHNITPLWSAVSAYLHKQLHTDSPKHIKTRESSCKNHSRELRMPVQLLHLSLTMVDKQ